MGDKRKITDYSPVFDLFALKALTDQLGGINPSELLHKVSEMDVDAVTRGFSIGAGIGLEDVLKMNVCLKDMANALIDPLSIVLFGKPADPQQPPEQEKEPPEA